MTGHILDLVIRGNSLGEEDLFQSDSESHFFDISTNVGINKNLQYFVTASGFYCVKAQVEVQGTDWYTLWFNVT